jgi:hypothetical protein
MAFVSRAFQETLVVELHAHGGGNTSSPVSSIEARPEILAVEQVLDPFSLPEESAKAAAVEELDVDVWGSKGLLRVWSPPASESLGRA